MKLALSARLSIEDRTIHHQHRNLLHIALSHLRLQELESDIQESKPRGSDPRLKISSLQYQT